MQRFPLAAQLDSIKQAPTLGWVVEPVLPKLNLPQWRPANCESGSAPVDNGSAFIWVSSTAVSNS